MIQNDSNETMYVEPVVTQVFPIQFNRKLYLKSLITRERFGNHTLDIIYDIHCIASNNRQSVASMNMNEYRMRTQSVSSLPSYLDKLPYPLRSILYVLMWTSSRTKILASLNATAHDKLTETCVAQRDNEWTPRRDNLPTTNGPRATPYGRLTANINKSLSSLVPPPCSIRYTRFSLRDMALCPVTGN